MARLTAARAALCLAVLTLGCHAVLPFTDHVSYDDLYWTNWATQGRWDCAAMMLSQCGNYPGYLYASAFAGVGDFVVTFKIVGVLTAWLAGWLIWRLGTRSGLLSAHEALFVAAVAIVFPIYKMKGGFAYSVYEITLCAFLLAALLAVRADAAAGWRHVVLRLAALLLLLYSYVMPSLLMFHGGFFLLLVLTRQRSLGLPWYRLPWRYCLARPDYLALPFVWWFVKTAFNPPWGPYATYNRPGFSLAAIRSGYATLPGVLLDPFTFCLALPLPYQLLLAAAAVAACLFAVRLLRGAEPLPADLGRAAGLFAFGAVLLLLGTAPYVAVNRVFSACGNWSTYAALVPIPLGVLLLATIEAARRLTPRLARLTPLVVSAALVCCLVVWWHNYLSMQAVQVRNDALWRRLAEHPQARRCTVYCVVNLFAIPRTMDNLFGWEWCYAECGIHGRPRSYAYNGLPSLGAIPEWFVRKSIAETTFPYSLTTVDPAGQQGVLVLRPKGRFRAGRAAAHYLWLKYTAPQRLGGFLDGVAQIEFYPGPWDPVAVRQAVEQPRRTAERR